MTTTCRFSKCPWTGPLNEIFSHCETSHPKCICEHKGKNYYDFVFDDITNEAFLLSGPNGLYWFCVDPREYNDELYRGIFHIGDSEPIDYTLKLGLIRDGRAEYLGPFKSRCEKTDLIYDLKFKYDYMAFIHKEMPSQQMRLYVGEYDDSDDVYEPTWDELSWDEEDERVNRMCVEKFTCCICYEYIKRDIRFCEKHHYVCLTCFDSMRKRGKFRCPICRLDYPYDCSDPVLERFLRMVKFPDCEGQEQELEHHQQQKRRRIAEQSIEISGAAHATGAVRPRRRNSI